MLGSRNYMNEAGGRRQQRPSCGCQGTAGSVWPVLRCWGCGWAPEGDMSITGLGVIMR